MRPMNVLFLSHNKLVSGKDLRIDLYSFSVSSGGKKCCVGVLLFILLTIKVSKGKGFSIILITRITCY